MISIIKIAWGFIKNSIVAQAAIVVAIVSLIGIALIAWANGAMDRAVDQARESGAAQYEGEVLAETLNRVEKANEAVQESRNDPVAARAGCLRYSRTKDHCD